MQFLGGLKPKLKPCNIDSNLLYIYLEHKLETITTNSARWIVDSTGVFLEANVGGFDVILGCP